MTAIANLLETLRASGGRIEAASGELKCTLPRTWTKQMRESFVNELRARKPEFLDALEAKPAGGALAACGARTCGGCYEVRPGVSIHPPNVGQLENKSEAWK